MLKQSEFIHLNRSVSFLPLLLIVGDWLLLSLGVFALTSSYFTIKIMGFLLLLRQQLALSVMMHEGVHLSLFPHKKINDLLGVFFCSGPILSHFHAYRTLHMKHHRHALSADDPGQYLLKSQKEASLLIRDFLKDLSGVTYFSLGQKADIGKISLGIIALNLAGQVLGLFIVWSLFKFNGLLTSDFLLFWVLPLVTLHQAILRIRALMEHGGFSYHKESHECTRSVKPGVLTKILAPHNINYHIEHHLYPTIPSYRLKNVSEKIDETLKENNDENYLKVAHSLFIGRFIQ